MNNYSNKSNLAIIIIIIYHKSIVPLWKKKKIVKKRKLCNALVLNFGLFNKKPNTHPKQASCVERNLLGLLHYYIFHISLLVFLISQSQKKETHKTLLAKKRIQTSSNSHESWKRRWLWPSHHDFLTRRSSISSRYVFLIRISLLGIVLDSIFFVKFGFLGSLMRNPVRYFWWVLFDSWFALICVEFNPKF